MTVDTASRRELFRTAAAAARNVTCPVFVAAIVAVTGGIAAATEARYVCSGGTHLEALFSPPGEQPGQVVLNFADGAKPVTLPQAMSADGGRYKGDGMEFWIKGNDATLTRAGTTETCHTK